MDIVAHDLERNSFFCGIERRLVGWKAAMEIILRAFLQNFLLFPFLRANCQSFEVQGIDKIERLNGPCVFVANHSSHADTAIILAALPSKLRSRLAIAAAADYFYRSAFSGKFFHLLLNTFAFDRHSARSAFRKARSVLDEGYSLLIYPEGTRTAPFQRHEFKRGFAMLACESGLPVVPIYIQGSYEMLPKGACWPHPAHVTIVFGDPVYPEGRDCADLSSIVESRVNELAGAA